MTIAETLGVVIRRLRVERGLSQYALSVSARLDRSFISRIESGKINPNLVSLFSLANGLGVSTHRILQEIEGVQAISDSITRSQLSRFPVDGRPDRLQRIGADVR
jgi:transcriptional regulator with XRE-family HTH domain